MIKTKRFIFYHQKRNCSYYPDGTRALRSIYECHDILVLINENEIKEFFNKYDAHMKMEKPSGVLSAELKLNRKFL
jgi:hypothetical protein